MYRFRGISSDVQIFSKTRGVRQTRTRRRDLETAPFAGYKFHQACVHSCSSYHSSPCQVVGRTPKWDNIALRLFYFRFFRFLGGTLMSPMAVTETDGGSFLQMHNTPATLTQCEAKGARFLERVSHFNASLQRGWTFNSISHCQMKLRVLHSRYSRLN